VDRFGDFAGYWYPIALEKDLGARPLRRLLFGLPCVIFRVDGKIGVLEDRCPHRNLPLSAGRIAGGALQCGYHGWRFSVEGRVVEVPGLADEDRPAALPCARSLQARISAGMVWVKAGDGPARADSPPRLEREDLRSEAWQVSSPASLANGAENFLDQAHTHYVHRGLIRTPGRRKRVTMALRPLPAGIEIEYPDEGNQAGLISRLFEPRRTVNYGRFLLPGIAQAEFRSERGVTLIATLLFTPAESSGPAGPQTVFIHLAYPRASMLYRLTAPALRAVFRRIVRQDLVILRQQANAIHIFGEERFVSTRLDAVGAHIRQILRAPGQPVAFPPYTVSAAL